MKYKIIDIGKDILNNVNWDSLVVLECIPNWFEKLIFKKKQQIKKFTGSYSTFHNIKTGIRVEEDKLQKVLESGVFLHDRKGNKK